MQNDPPYLRVGLTGGIGSGKSTVAAVFRSLGRLVISADDVARSLTDHDSDVHAGIRREFGPSVFRRDGSLDRRALASIVFATPDRLAALNAIVHPLVFKAIEERLEREPLAILRPYVVIEAALIFESGMDCMLDRVVVVDAPEKERIRRVVQRDGSTRQEVLRRIAAQMSPAERKDLADLVILNDKNTVVLDEKVRFVDLLLRAAPARDLPDNPVSS